MSTNEIQDTETGIKRLIGNHEQIKRFHNFQQDSSSLLVSCSQDRFQICKNKEPII